MMRDRQPSYDSARRASRRSATPHLRRLIDPLRLQLILELARQGSISKAAVACSIGQPSASLHLRKLEGATGHRIYERVGQQTRLTDAGRLLARHAEVVLSALEGLEQDLAALEGGLVGMLRLSVCDGFGNYVLPEVLERFMSDHPLAQVGVRVRQSGEVLEDMAKGAANLGIAGEIKRVPGVAGVRLTVDELVPVSTRHSGVVPLAAVQDDTFLVSTPHSSTRAVSERVLEGAGWTLPKTLELESAEALKRAVRAGLGFAIISRSAVDDELMRGELSEFELAGVGKIERRLEIVRLKYREPAPLEREFERVLRDWLADRGRCHAVNA